jgi:hypothetical protein
MADEKPRARETKGTAGPEHSARKLRRAAEREAARESQANREERQKADVEAAEASQVLTPRELRKGHPVDRVTSHGTQKQDEKV